MNPITKTYLERKKKFEEKHGDLFDALVKIWVKMNEQYKSVDINIPFSRKQKILASQKSDILAILEAVEKWVEEHNQSDQETNDYYFGYNQCLSDILFFLKEAKEEIKQNK